MSVGPFLASPSHASGSRLSCLLSGALVQALNVPTAALVFSVLSGYLFKQYNCLRLGQYNKVNALPGWGLAPPHPIPRGMPLAQQKCWWASKCLWGVAPRPDTGPDSLHHPVIPAIEPTASCFCHQLAPYYCMGQALGLRGTTALCSFSVMPYSLLCLVGFAFLRKCPRESSPINIAPSSSCLFSVEKTHSARLERQVVANHEGLMSLSPLLWCPQVNACSPLIFPVLWGKQRDTIWGVPKKVPMEQIALLAFLGAQLSHQGWARQMFMIPSEGGVWLCSGRMLYPRG